MRWFEGTISEAIAEAKKKKAVFVVYISGEDERSVTMNTTFESEEVSSKLENEGCVAIKVQGNSDVCQQFSQIYPVVLIPSTYFIGDNGMPLEIIGGDITPQEFLTKVEGVIKNKSSIERSEAGSTSEDRSGMPTDKVEGSKESDQKPSRESVTDPSSSTSNSSIDDKVERAKQLMLQQRQQKAKMDLEEEKGNELKRRKVGQDVQKNRVRQEDVEAKQRADDLAKERAEDRAAREHIKSQIAKDRAERAAKFQTDKQETERAKLEAQQTALQEQRDRAAVEAAERSDQARLQFRFPDGSSLTNQFAATDTLSAVRSYLQECKKCEMRDFTLSTTFPRREFEAPDYSQTLRDLRLAPCAVLLVLPNRGSIIPQNPLNIVWTILAPLFALFNYLRTLFLGSEPTPSTSSSEPPRNSNDDSTARGPGPGPGPGPAAAKKSKTADRPGEGGSNFSRKDGNVHRFSNQDDEDDENNTWNGNSTQQM